VSRQLPRATSGGMTTANPMDPASSLVDAVVRLERAIVQIGNTRLRPWKMTLSSYTALKVMANRPDLSLVQLSRRCFVRPQTMTRIVWALEERRLVERLPNPDSERALRLRVTKRGQLTLAEMDVAVNEIQDTIGDIFDAEQIELFDTMLRRFAYAVEGEIETFPRERAPGRANPST